jgi:hypothetical protein
VKRRENRSSGARLALIAAAVGLSAACGDENSENPGAGSGASSGTGAVAGISGSGAGSAGTSGASAGGTSVGGAGGASAGGAGAAVVAGGGAAGTAGTGGAAGSVTSGGTAGDSGASGSSGAGGSAGAGAGAAGTGGGSGGNHPFPVNTRSERCTYPTNANPEHARAAYEAWKTNIVTADGARGFLRTRRPNSPGAEVNSTVSEGIAYGMILAVVMSDQPTFDALWMYSQQFLNENGLMHWYINAAGTSVLGSGGATDSDEDIAWALILADRQWGGSGSIGEPYIDAAKRQIQAVWDHEIDHSRNGFLLPGDTWGGDAPFNPSYFAPNEYRMFGEVSGNVDGWNQVIDTGYAMLETCLNEANGNEENGLAPAWCSAAGVPGDPPHYQYDSARVPFRIGQDYCYSGEPRAAAYLAKISAFFANIGAANIVDGYDLNGTPHPDADSDPNGPQSAVFVGSAAVGAMHDPAFQTLVDEAYALVATGELLARSTYYNHSWTGLTLLMLTGNLVEWQ